MFDSCLIHSLVVNVSFLLCLLFAIFVFMVIKTYFECGNLITDLHHIGLYILKKIINNKFQSFVVIALPIIVIKLIF